MSDDVSHQPRPVFWRSRFGIGWLVLAAVAGWFLWEEHRAHLLGALPYLLLLACPLMHVFMHRGHRGHAQRGGDAPPGPSAGEQP
jgi:hypothetical protein